MMSRMFIGLSAAVATDVSIARKVRVGIKNFMGYRRSKRLRVFYSLSEIGLFVASVETASGN